MNFKYILLNVIYIEKEWFLNKRKLIYCKVIEF